MGVVVIVLWLFSPCPARCHVHQEENDSLGHVIIRSIRGDPSCLTGVLQLAHDQDHFFELRSDETKDRSRRILRAYMI
jgi:hypothetical protein